MLPSVWRAPMSNFLSRKRCVVSSCVSTTIEEKCSFLARAEMSSDFTATANKPPAETQSAVVRKIRSISILISP